nr:2-polyprenylphenol hydroxylase [Corynebacterium crudilactis]
MGGVTPRPVSSVARLVEDNAQDFLRAVKAQLLQLAPQSRGHFPTDDDLTHISIAETLSALLDGTGKEGEVDEGTLAFFQEAALDARRFGITPDMLKALGEAVRTELLELCSDLPFENVLFAERAIAATSAASIQAVREAEEADIPASFRAEVVEVEKRSRRFTVVRLQAEQQLPYSPGQYLAATADFLPNTWRYVCPSIPSNEWGQVEFHIQSDADETTGLLATSRPGDKWTLGPGRGDFGKGKTDSGKDLLFISHGTGLAPLRAYVFELMNQAAPPRLHFFVGADFPGELYELMGLWNFAAASPWLSVVPVSTHEHDDWWVQATEASQPPRGLHLHQTGPMAKIVTQAGAWADREVLIAGPESWARDVRRAMIRRGTPAAQIETLGF